MDTVKLKINGIEVEAPQGSTILEAARWPISTSPPFAISKTSTPSAPAASASARSRARAPMPPPAFTRSTEGMEVFTNTPKIRAARKKTIELILSTHRRECLSCVRSGNCELQKLAQEYGCDEHRYETTIKTPDIVDVNDVLIRDNSKCVLCRRCVAACKYNQGVAVIGANERGYETHIAPAFDMPLAQAACISCGQCITVCPTGALRERDDTDKVWKALGDPTKHVVVGTAPSVRAQIGEEFGYPMGTNTEGKMTAALRRLGFDGVFDVDTAADFTIMEEGTEFINRFTKGGKLPLITSCSPGWIKYCELYYPEFIDNLSTCKSRSRCSAR